MNTLLLLVAALATGEGGSQEAAVRARIVEHPFSWPSTWELEWFEEDGKREKRWGGLSLEKGVCGTLDVFPRATWNITASRIKGGPESGSFEWDIRWEGEFAGQGTLYGIYRVRNNRLWLCFNHQRDKPPTDFTTKPDDSRTVLVLRCLK
jgi:hypothetical protein